jgi:hypothetical protein
MGTRSGTSTSRSADDGSFEWWVDWVFAGDPDNDDSYFVRCRREPDLTLERLTRLFRDPVFLLGRYGPKAIDRGIAFLIDSCRSGDVMVVRDVALAWPRRLACIEAIYELFATLFARMYGDQFSSVRLPGKPVHNNFACFMFWDIIAIPPESDHPDHDRILEAIGDVLERQLTIPSLACQESALHGWGEYHLFMPDRCRDVVGRYLERDDLLPELREYAEDAREGQVL